MKRMKNIIVLIISILAFWAIDAQAQTPEGVWSLEQCEIKKDSAGVVSMVDYQLKEGNIPKWDIYTELTLGSDESCSIVLNNTILKGKYSLPEEGVLVLDFILMLPKYHYSLINNTTLALSLRRYLYDEKGQGTNFVDIKLFYSKK